MWYHQSVDFRPIHELHDLHSSHGNNCSAHFRFIRSIAFTIKESQKLKWVEKNCQCKERTRNVKYVCSNCFCVYCFMCIVSCEEFHPKTGSIWWASQCPAMCWKYKYVNDFVLFWKGCTSEENVLFSCVSLVKLFSGMLVCSLCRWGVYRVT